jgi:hypothetical protein
MLTVYEFYYSLPFLLVGIILFYQTFLQDYLMNFKEEYLIFPKLVSWKDSVTNYMAEGWENLFLLKSHLKKNELKKNSFSIKNRKDYYIFSIYLCYVLFCFVLKMYVHTTKKFINEKYKNLQITTFLTTKNKTIKNGNFYEITYFIDDKEYKMVIKEKRGPKDVLQIIGDDEDITDMIEPYLGPYNNFHGSVFTPSFFKKDFLSFQLSNGNEITFEKDEEINLVKFID